MARLAELEHEFLWGEPSALQGIEREGTERTLASMSASSSGTRLLATILATRLTMTARSFSSIASLPVSAGQRNAPERSSGIVLRFALSDRKSVV